MFQVTHILSIRYSVTLHGMWISLSHYYCCWNICDQEKNTHFFGCNFWFSLKRSNNYIPNIWQIIMHFCHTQTHINRMKKVLLFDFRRKNEDDDATIMWLTICKRASNCLSKFNGKYKDPKLRTKIYGKSWVYVIYENNGHKTHFSYGISCVCDWSAFMCIRQQINVNDPKMPLLTIQHRKTNRWYAWTIVAMVRMRTNVYAPRVSYLICKMPFREKKEFNFI